MNFIYVIHLLYWNQLTDLIIHSRSNRSNKSNRNNSIHCNNKGARALCAHARPFVVSVPLLFLLFCLTKILTKKLTWAGLGQALGWARVKPLGKLPQFSQGPPKMLKNGAPGIFLASWN